MTQEQATDIRRYLIDQLNENGFGDIVVQVDTRLRVNNDKDPYGNHPQFLLDFFLEESINVLESLSNKNYNGMIRRFNDVLSGEIKLEGISVALLDRDEQESFDLRGLPDYSEITRVFREILDEIRKEG